MHLTLTGIVARPCRNNHKKEVFESDYMRIGKCGKFFLKRSSAKETYGNASGGVLRTKVKQHGIVPSAKRPITRSGAEIS